MQENICPCSFPMLCQKSSDVGVLYLSYERFYSQEEPGIINTRKCLLEFNGNSTEKLCYAKQTGITFTSCLFSLPRCLCLSGPLSLCLSFSISVLLLYLLSVSLVSPSLFILASHCIQSRNLKLGFLVPWTPGFGRYMNS